MLLCCCFKRLYIRLFQVLREIGQCPPRVIVWSAWWMLVAELLILLIVNPVFFRDSSEYYALTEAFRLGAWDRAFPPHLPVLYTVFSGILAKIGIPAVSSLLLVSGFFTALTVFPLYGWLRAILSPRKAAWGVFLYALFPEIIRCGCAPLLDSGRFFFLSAALWLIFCNWESKYVSYKIFLLGVVYAGLILVRAEGICFVAITTVIHILILLHRLKGKLCFIQFCRIAGCVLLPLLLAALLCTPRAIQMQKMCGFPGIDSRQVKGIRSFISLVAPEVKKQTAAPSNPAPGSGRSQITVSRSDNAKMAASRIMILLDQPRYYRNLLGGLNPWYLPFTLLGLFVLFRRRQINFNHGMVVLLFFAYCGFHFIIRAGAGRYLLMAGVLLIPFTVEGGAAAGEWLRKRDSRLLHAALLLLAVFAGVQFIRSLGELRDGKNQEYRTIRSLFQEGGPLNKAERSGLSRPVILLIGPDRGLGFYAGVNVILYTDYPFALPSRMTLEEILEQGVSSTDFFHWQTKETPKKAHIDVVVTYKNQWHPVREAAGRFEEYNFPEQNKLRVWKVIQEHLVEESENVEK